MASNFTQKGKLEIAQQALDLVSEANLKLVLVDDSYVHDATRDFVDDGTTADVTSHEISTTGYTAGFGNAGRRVPASRVLNRDDAAGKIEFDFADEVWSSLGSGVTIGGVVGIVEKTSDSDSWVIFFDDTTNVSTNDADVTYSPNTDGVLRM